MCASLGVHSTISLLIFFNDNVSKDQIKKLSNKYGEFIEQEPAGSGYIVKVREDSILDFINNKEVRWVEEVGPPPTTH